MLRCVICQIVKQLSDIVHVVHENSGNNNSYSFTKVLDIMLKREA